MTFIQTIKRLFRREASSVEAIADGEEPLATTRHDPDRETSTNAQTEGAADEPWGGSR